jgi:cystathionine beta-lyase
MQRWTLKWSDQPPAVLPAWVAETDFPLAPPVRRALLEAVERSDVGYPPREERSPLRTAWTGWLSDTYGWEVHDDAVHAVPGAVKGLYAAVWAFTAPGDGVVVTPPIYKPFLEAPLELARERIDVPLVPDGARHVLDLDGLERAFRHGARLLLLCHPHNPTGTVFPPAELRALAELCAAHDVAVVSDEVHAPLVMPEVAFTPYAVAGGDAATRAVTLVSMSKAFNFAGLHCGATVLGAAAEAEWLAVPRRLRSGSGILGVLATVAALSREGRRWLGDLVTYLDVNRRHLIASLPAVLPGVVAHPPEATYLLWLDCRETEHAEDPAAWFLRHGVRVSPGEEFGADGQGRVRLNYATSRALLDELLGRLAA